MLAGLHYRDMKPFEVEPDENVRGEHDVS